MFKIIENSNYDAEKATADQKGKYLLVSEDGETNLELTVWYEAKLKSDTNPKGKPHIKLPKDNPTHRQFISEQLFIDNNVNGEFPVAVKEGGPRVIGASGVKQSIVKFLSEDEANEYTSLVNNAVEAYKAAKGSNKKKRPEEMSVEELQAYIDAIKNGVSFKVTNGPKSFIDMFTEDELNRYHELLAISAENKANAPKAQRNHGPLSDEEKAARAAKRKQTELSKAEKLLQALMNSSSTPVAPYENESETEDDNFDDDDLDDEEDAE